MSPDNPFHQALLLNPDDDTPRLVFADWLDEHGQPDRAEFIRVQIELTRYAPDDPACGPLRRREAELWVVNRKAWKADVPDIFGINWRGYIRGFLSVIDADSAELVLSVAPTVFAAAPIQSVRILQAEAGDGQRLAGLPLLARVLSLDLTGCRNLEDADADALAASPHLRQLRALRLGGNRISLDAIRRVRRTFPDARLI